MVSLIRDYILILRDSEVVTVLPSQRPPIVRMTIQRFKPIKHLDAPLRVFFARD